MVRASGTGARRPSWESANRRRRLARHGLAALAVAAACACLLATAPAAHAGWPSNSTRWNWTPSNYGSPGLTGWGNDQTFTTALMSALDVVPYGDTYVYYWDANQRSLCYQAFAFSSGAHPAVTALGSSGIAAPGWSGFYTNTFLGACSTGNDVFVFYGKVLYSEVLPTIYWTQASENYNVEHSAAADWLGSVSGYDNHLLSVIGRTPEVQNFFVCDVAFLDGTFAFVSLDAQDATGTSYNVFLTDLSGTELPNHAQSFNPAGDNNVAPSQGVLRDVSALPFAYQGDTYLAVAGIFGQPSYSTGPAGWCPQPGGLVEWSNMHVSVALSSFSDQGFAEPVLDRDTWSAPAWPLIAASVTSYYAATDVFLARGGLSGGPTGDQLTIMLRSCYVDWDWSSSTNNFEFELYDSYQMGVSGAGMPTLTLGDPDSEPMAVCRLPQQDNNKNNFAIWNPTTTAAFLWAQPEQTGTAVTQGAYPYYAWNQRLWLAAAAGVTVWEQSGSKSKYTGIIGSIIDLSSDQLKPVPYDATDEDGNALPATDPDTGVPLPTVSGTPVVKYPATPANEDMAVPDADATQCVLQGVVYGSPPYALNGWNPAAPPAGISALSFGTSSGTTSSTSNENKGSISLSGSWTNAAKTFSAGASAGWSIDQQTTQTKASSQSEIWSTQPGGPYGQIYFKQPVWEVQRFQREDYTGAEIPREYLVAWNCVDSNGVEGAFAFNMTSVPTATPDPLAPLNTYFAGMTGAPATGDYFNWHQRMDPVTMAGTHGSVVEQPDGQTKLQATVTGNAAAATLFTKVFTQSEATTKSMANSVNTKANILFFKLAYSHTWANATTTSTGKSFQFSWQLPGPAVSVPYVINEQVQQALDNLAAAGLNPAYRTAAGSSAAPGSVVSQSPDPGTYVGAGAPVTVFIAPLSADQPAPTVATPATVAPEVSSMTIEGVFMEANDDQAYWIPAAYRAHVDGQRQKPWCVDWSVLAYTPGAQVAARDPAATLSCAVKVRARPVHGGSARVLTSSAATGHYGTAAANGTLIAASPAIGYRFAGWRLHGADVARIVGAQQERATVIPKLAGGGVTATAQFVRIKPRAVGLERLDADSAHVRLEGAPLARGYAGPRLSGGTSGNAGTVAVQLGDDLYEVPAAAWRPLARSGGKVYRFAASFRPRRWDQRDDRLSVTVDTRANTWSVLARGADGVDELYRGVAAGQLPVSLLVAGRRVSHADYPVASTVRFMHQKGVGALLASAAGARVRPVNLDQAELLVRLSPDDYRKSTLVVRNAVIAPRLLKRSGFVLDVNGIQAQIAAARRSGSTYIARGRTPEGIAVTCRWSRSGTATISLSQGYLESELAGIVGRNLVISVGDGSDMTCGTMVTSARHLTAIGYAPRLADD